MIHFNFMVQRPPVIHDRMTNELQLKLQTSSRYISIAKCKYFYDKGGGMLFVLQKLHHIEARENFRLLKTKDRVQLLQIVFFEPLQMHLLTHFRVRQTRS